ncbi:MAG TPA: DUF2971 domain-containing protein [Terracidiphilus sp.]|jgi:hypothetical protein
MEEQEHQHTEGRAKPEGLLYHYTTQEGLLGIIEKQEFWATDVRFLNDMEEFEAGIKIALRMSEQASAEAGEDGRKTVAYFENVLRFSFSERPIYSISFAGPLKKDETLFASIDDPGDRLNMWRGYSGRGIAYSIGLSRDGWATNIDGVDLQECSYLQETKEEYLTEALNKFGELLNACYTIGKEALREGASIEDANENLRQHLDSKLDEIIPDVKAQIAACKHESFWEEREWRLTVAPEPNGGGVFYTSGRFGITPRVRVHLRGTDGLLPIKRVVVGPCPHIRDAMKSLRGLLIRNGYSNLQLSASQIPYRNW